MKESYSSFNLEYIWIDSLKNRNFQLTIIQI